MAKMCGILRGVALGAAAFLVANYYIGQNLSSSMHIGLSESPARCNNAAGEVLFGPDPTADTAPPCRQTVIIRSHSPAAGPRGAADFSIAC